MKSSRGPRTRVRWKHRLEYLAIRSLLALLNALPLPVAYATAAGCAAVAYRLGRRRAREARRRIAQVFPTLSSREVSRIARASLRNLFFNAVELARFPRLGAEWRAKFVDRGNFDAATAKARSSGCGAIFAVPHMGNWDLAGLVLGAEGWPMFFLVGRQRNPLADAHLQRLRGATGLEFLYREETSAREVLKRLRDGKVFGVVPDVRMPNPGVPVTLFGHPADIPSGVPLFAIRARVPLLVSHTWRKGWRRHEWSIDAVIEADPSADAESEAKRIAQIMADCFTEAVRRHPDCYFWYNKRWVLEPRATQALSTVSAAGNPGSTPSVSGDNGSACGEESG